MEWSLRSARTPEDTLNVLKSSGSSHSIDLGDPVCKEDQRKQFCTLENEQNSRGSRAGLSWAQEKRARIVHTAGLRKKGLLAG